MTYPAQADSASSDAQLAAQQVALELAARDLYDVAIDAGADDPIWQTLREQHDSFAQRLAGIVGEKAQGPSTELADEYADGFVAADPSARAIELEDYLAATYTAKLGEVTVSTKGDVIAGAFASILTSESRHAVLLSAMAGADGAPAMFVNPITEVDA